MTLPLAWFFYAVAFALVPYAESAFRRWFMGGSFLPLAGWAVAAASVAHVSAFGVTKLLVDARWAPYDIQIFVSDFL